MRFLIDAQLPRRARWLALGCHRQPSNKDLLRMFEDNLQMIAQALEAVDFIEIDGESITWRQ